MAGDVSTGKKIFTGVLGGAGLTLVNILVSLTQIRLVIQFLPSELAGIWFLFLSIGLYVNFFDLGVSPTLSREIGFVLGRSDQVVPEGQHQISDLIATCQRLFQWLAGGILVVGGFAGAWFLQFVSPPEFHQVVLFAWLFFVIGAALNILGGAGFAALYGMGNVATERSIRACCQLLWLLFLVVALNLGYGLLGLAAAWALANVVARIWAWFELRRLYPWLLEVKGQPRITILRKIAIPSLKWASISLGALLILQSDNFIIAVLLGPAQIPHYEAVLKIMITLMTFSLLIVTSSTPFLSKAHAAGNTDEFNRLLFRNVRYGMGVMIVLAMFLSVFGDKVIDVWLGEGNFVGFPVLWFLLAMVVLEVHHVIHATAVMATGHIVFLKSAIGAAVIKVALSVSLAVPYGLLGVASGTLIAQILTNNWYAPLVSMRLFKIGFIYYVKNILVGLLVLAVCMFFLNLGLKNIMSDQYNIFKVVLLALISTGFGSVLCFFILFTKEEKKHYFSRLALVLK